jgi:hypothetical protein
MWPWLIVFAPRRVLGPTIVMAIASAPIFRWWLATQGYRENLLAVLTPGSLDSLGMGALLALLNPNGWHLTPPTSFRQHFGGTSTGVGSLVQSR